MRNLIRTTVLAAAIALSTGCLFYAGPRPGVIYIGIAPPTPAVEVIVASPGPRYAWRPGYWRWQVREYIWVPGGWMPMEPGYRQWMPGRWEHDRHGWYWIEGRWR